MTASGRFVIRMDPHLHAALRAAAREAGTSLNDYCVQRLAMPGRGSVPAARVVQRAAAIAGASLVGVANFGSWSRGEAAAGSDVDVLIVVDASLPVTRELYHRWDAAACEWDGLRVEPHFAQLPAPDDRISGLWAEVALDGIVLFERGFELSHSLARIRSRILSGEVVRRWSNGVSYWVAA